MSEAEDLLDFAIAIMYPKRLLVVTDCIHCIGRVKLALDFLAAPATLRFRAIVEEWPLDRIVQELRA